MKRLNINKNWALFIVTMLMLSVSPALYGEEYTDKNGSPYAWFDNFTDDTYSVSFGLRAPGLIYGHKEFQTRTEVIPPTTDEDPIKIDLAPKSELGSTFEYIPRIGYKDSVITIKRELPRGVHKGKYSNVKGVSMKMDQEGRFQEVQDYSQGVQLIAQWHQEGSKVGWYFTIAPLIEEEEMRKPPVHSQMHKEPKDKKTYTYHSTKRVPEKEEPEHEEVW